MKRYTVSQLAKMAGVTARTLHHYDHIGLLKPTSRTASGYRLYAQRDLLRLQQVLFFKELEFPLSEIRDILDDPSFDQMEALKQHRTTLLRRTKRLKTLISSIDKTLQTLAEDNMTLTDEELYEGFTDEQIERYKREVSERYDPEMVQEADRRVRRMSKAQFDDVKAEGERVTRAIAALIDRAPDDPEIQGLIARHHAWVNQFYHVSAEIYCGLGQLYVEHEEFRAYYEGFGPGLAEFMRAAMTHFADNSLSAG